MPIGKPSEWRVRVEGRGDAFRRTRTPGKGAIIFYDERKAIYLLPMIMIKLFKNLEVIGQKVPKIIPNSDPPFLSHV